ncbi:MAG TPA: BON domain-containing protein [Paraburkholderia sp.]|jgi:hyperosmotically inducible protein|nr:BON domain-containing protein [Paraburkholderia sp.]
MKSVDFLKALAVAACLAMTGGAFAQNDAGTTGSTGTGGTAPTHESKGQHSANRKLGYAVRRAIGREQDVDVSNITVRSHGGDITLLGTVPDQSQIDKAEAAAKGVSGVKSVTNKLTVQQQ